MKKLKKNDAKNDRLDAPLGRLGVPPDILRGTGRIITNATVIIVESPSTKHRSGNIPQ